MTLRALFSSLVAIERILILLNAKQMGLVNCVRARCPRCCVRQEGLIRYICIAFLPFTWRAFISSPRLSLRPYNGRATISVVLKARVRAFGPKPNCGRTRFRAFGTKKESLQPAHIVRFVPYGRCTSPEPTPGQDLVTGVLDHLHDILETRDYIKVNIQWVPGHTEVIGNEKADNCAKSAAEPPRWSGDSFTSIPSSAPNLVGRFKRVATEQQARLKILQYGQTTTTVGPT